MDENPILDQTEDLLSEIVNESGIGLESRQTTLNEDLEYEEIANEILNTSESQNPKVIKKRLKYDRKYRTENSAFLKRKIEIEAKIENYKKDWNEEQIEIRELERDLKLRNDRLQLIQKEIEKYKT